MTQLNEEQEYILRELGMVWRQHPTFRFGELVCTLGIVRESPWLWNQTDDKTAKRLRERRVLK